MTKEEVKLWLRSQIESYLLIQSKHKNVFCLHYNMAYLRAKKLSTITGKPVNKDNFKSGIEIFGLNPITKRIWYYSEIRDYLYENCSNDYSEHFKLVEEVLNEYEEYKGYNLS